MPGFLLLICGFNPLLKLWVHQHAMMIVTINNIIVITAKLVSERRAGI